jgi:uroporphyrinogen-III synthase
VSSAHPLAGKRILVTRARHQAGKLAEALEALGAEVLRLPTIEIIPPETYAHLDAVLEVISGFDWLIVTSANGAAALADRMQFLGIHAGRLQLRLP